MFAMFVMLAVIATVVSAVFFIYFKYVKIKNSTARKMEICGYCILLVLIIWEFGIKNIAMNEFYNLDFWVIKEKIDYVFLGIKNLSSGSSVDSLYANYGTIEDGNDYVNMQMLFVDIAELIMQVLSTLFIAIGRFQELRKKEK